MLRRILIVALLLTACSANEQESPHVVAPSSPPRSTQDVVGIWRNVHQGLLELRDSGAYVLISSITEPEKGTYTLTDDQLVVRGEKSCGDAAGRYRVRVDRARRMDLTDGDDPCTERRRVMQSDPWIYTPR